MDTTLNKGYPIPLVKHGIISFVGSSSEVFLIDAINNPGFSGSPVISVDNQQNPTIIGVASGYKAYERISGACIDLH